MKNYLLICFFLLASLFLLSCGKELPGEWKSLEGTWENEEVLMTITSGGGFTYKRVSPGEKVSIDSYISEYSNKGFSASMIVSTIDFSVNRKPFFNDSTKTTQMVVDGRLLTKRDNW
jgi:hypothetical protein